MNNKSIYYLLLVIILLISYFTNLFYGVISASLIAIYYAYKRNKISKVYICIGAIIYVYGMITK